MGIENGKTFTIDDEARIAEMAELAKKGIEVVWIDEVGQQKIIACPEKGVYGVDNEGKPIEPVKPPIPKVVTQQPTINNQPNIPSSPLASKPILNDPEKVRQYAERVGKARGIY